MIAQQLFGGELADGKRINELDQRFFIIQLALFIPTFLQHLSDLGRGRKDLCQTVIDAGVKVDLGQRLLDIGETEGDVFVNGHIGPQGIVLEQEADPTLIGGDIDAHGAIKYDLIPDGDTAAGGGLQTRNHT